MEMRTLGRTGVKVSSLCLGAMMFGGWGNPDHDDSVRIIHRGLEVCWPGLPDETGIANTERRVAQTRS